MSRPTKVNRLRAQLAACLAAPGPAGMRGRELWALAQQVSEMTGQPVRGVFERAVRDVVARQMREAFP